MLHVCNCRQYCFGCMYVCMSFAVVDKDPGKRGLIVADINFSLFARARNICCGHKFCVRDTKNVSDFVQKHFVSATNVSQFAQPKKHHRQQCVRNNVSSFTRAFRDQIKLEPRPNWSPQGSSQGSPQGSSPVLLSIFFSMIYLINQQATAMYYIFINSEGSFKRSEI